MHESNSQNRSIIFLCWQRRYDSHIIYKSSFVPVIYLLTLVNIYLWSNKWFCNMCSKLTFLPGWESVMIICLRLRYKWIGKASNIFSVRVSGAFVLSRLGYDKSTSRDMTERNNVMSETTIVIVDHFSSHRIIWKCLVVILGEKWNKMKWDGIRLNRKNDLEISLSCI